MNINIFLFNINIYNIFHTINKPMNSEILMFVVNSSKVQVLKFMHVYNFLFYCYQIVQISMY